MNRILSMCLLSLVVIPGLAQTESQSGKEELSYRNTITVSVGRASRLNRVGDYTPKSIGADYLYRVHPKWEVGMQVDLGFSDQNNDPDQFLVVGIAAYSVSNRWPIFAGFGIENSKHGDGTILLARIGTEYAFFLDKKQHFAILPGAFVDFTKHGGAPSLVLAFGFFFGEMK